MSTESGSTSKGILYPTGGNVFPSEEWWKSLSLSVDAAIAAVEETSVAADEYFGVATDPSVDLDTVTTLGAYLNPTDAGATFEKNYPIEKAGRLEVAPFNYAQTHTIQTYYPFRHEGFFIRFFYSGSPFSEWMEYPTTTAVDSAIAEAIAAFDLPPLRSSTTTIACIGDSLTQGYSAGEQWAAADNYPSKLAAALGVETVELGYVGCTTDQINLLVGAFPITFEVPGGVVSTSGITALASDVIIGGWDSSDSISLLGYLDGIYGRLTYNPTDGYSFDGAGSGPDRALTRATFTGAFVEQAADTVIYMAGRNDVSKDVSGMEADPVEHVVRGTVDMVNFLTPRKPRFVVTGTTLRLAETVGTPGYDAVTEINARIKALYPANFCDVQGYLTNQALSDMGVTPTQADLDAQANGEMPPSVMDDDTHWSRAAAAALAEHLFAPFLRHKGWF